MDYQNVLKIKFNLNLIRGAGCGLVLLIPQAMEQCGLLKVVLYWLIVQFMNYYEERNRVY